MNDQCKFHVDLAKSKITFFFKLNGYEKNEKKSTYFAKLKLLHFW